MVSISADYTIAINLEYGTNHFYYNAVARQQHYYMWPIIKFLTMRFILWCTLQSSITEDIFYHVHSTWSTQGITLIHFKTAKYIYIDVAGMIYNNSNPTKLLITRYYTYIDASSLVIITYFTNSLHKPGS